MEYHRELGIPRAKQTYRWWRKNNSVLNRDKKDWEGVEAKYVDIHPPLIKITSKRGETSYRELW